MKGKIYNLERFDWQMNHLKGTMRERGEEIERKETA